MYPILFRIGPITIYTYGAIIAGAFFLCLSYTVREAKKEGIDPELVVDLGFYLLIAIIVGSRLLFVITNSGDYSSDPLAIFKIWEGGLVFYGGFIAVIFVAVFYLKKHNINVWKMADIYAPAIPLGQGVGRWGCFFAGCCYGKPSDLPWAVMFTHPHSIAPKNIYLHPTQLYDFVNNMIIFSILLMLKRRKKFDGHIFWIYTLLYAIGRFIVERFRGDDRGVLIPNAIFSTSQLIGIGIAIVSIIMLYRLKGKGIGPALTKR